MANASTALAGDIEFVVTQPTQNINWRYAALIETPNGPVENLKVISQDTLENYATAYSGPTTVEILMGLGAYSHRIHPNREKLTITIVRFNPGNTSDNEFNVYDAKLLETTNPTIDAAGLAQASELTLDLSDVVVVTFQLLNRAVEQLRQVRVGTVFRDASAATILESALTYAIQQIEMDADLIPTGVELLGEPNPEVYPQVIVPDMTDLVSLPGYLQKKQTGIYPTDIGHFFKNHTWYVYPLYDTTRFNDGRNTLNITMVPANLMAGVDRTYRIEGNSTYILCAGDREIMHDGEADMVRDGEGVRFADPDRLLGDWLDLSQENKAIAARARNVSEIVMDGEKKESMQAPMSSNPFTSNKYKELSKLAARKGSYFRCEWHHANKQVLLPGMMARIKYLDQGIVRWFEGTLVTAVIQDRLLGKGITSNTYGCSVMLVFFVNRDLDLGDDGSDVTDADLF